MSLGNQSGAVKNRRADALVARRSTESLLGTLPDRDGPAVLCLRRVSLRL